MKITNKIIEELGGLPIHHFEGGGCEFYVKGRGISIVDRDMPKTVSELVKMLMDKSFYHGSKDGEHGLQEELKGLLNI